MKKILFIFTITLLLNGCAGISSRIAPVAFEDPMTRLGIVNVQPTAQEQAGVLLRFEAPAVNILKSTEETVMFGQIKENEGKEIRVNVERVETYQPGGRQNTYLVHAECTVDEHPRAIVEDIEVTDRGEIVKFIRAVHDSKAGKFKVTDWKRTPLLPEGHVKIGDAWSYQESVTLQIDSFWIKQKDASPYQIEAKSKLTGFAEVRGARCAVIETEANQRQDHRFKFLWKDIALDVRAKIRETAYLDYQKGVILAKIARTETDTTSPDAGTADHSISQTLSWVLSQ